MSRSLLLKMAIISGCVLTMPAYRATTCAFDCTTTTPGQQTGYQPWAKNTHVKVNTLDLPADVTAKDSQGNNVTVHPRAAADAAIAALNNWVVSNTSSGVTFEAATSGPVTVAVGQAASGSAPAALTPGTLVNGRIANPTLTIDLNGNATSAYTTPSNRTGTVPWFDPTGTWSGQSDPSVAYIDSIKDAITHELMHTLGIANITGCGTSAMQGAYVPSDRASDGTRCKPASIPTDCDQAGLKNLYPPSPEEDPEWWYFYCGVDEQTVFDCEHQQDYYWYDFEGGCTCSPGASPIIVDLDGDGIPLTDSGRGVSFDIFGTGAPVLTGWTRPGARDGFLVLDRDGNGLIDGGAELFGNVTEQPAPGPGEARNGFRALAVFDEPSTGGNGDGVITSVDGVFNRLRLWIDANHDGFSQSSELFTLASQAVARINLDYHESRRLDAYGNAFRYFSNVVLRNPLRVRRAVDVFFRWQ